MPAMGPKISLNELALQLGRYVARQMLSLKFVNKFWNGCHTDKEYSYFTGHETENTKNENKMQLLLQMKLYYMILGPEIKNKIRLIKNKLRCRARGAEGHESKI